MIVKFRKVNKQATAPTKGTIDSAGFDLYSVSESVIINPGETKPISIGIQIEIPKNYAGFIYARSGLGCRYGLVPSNCVGVIDSDYRGEIIVYLHNHNKHNAYRVNPGDKIAQLVITYVPEVIFECTEVLSNTERNTKGFGSTGR